MAGVAVDRYGFVYDRLTPPATDDVRVSSRLVETNESSVHLARGSVGRHLYSPAAHPPSTTLFSGRL